MNSDDLPGVRNGRPAPEILSAIERELTADLTAVRPLQERWFYFAALLGLLLCVIAVGVYRLHALALGVMTPLQAWGVMAALAVSAGLLANSLANQMAPGSRYHVSPGVLPVLVFIALAGVMVLLFPVVDEHNFWKQARWCLRTGTLAASFAVAPVWLVLRRGAFLDLRSMGVASGLLVGLSGATILELHCPNLDLRHILVAHLGVAVAGAVAGLLVGWGLDLRERTRKIV